MGRRDGFFSDSQRPGGRSFGEGVTPALRQRTGGRVGARQSPSFKDHRIVVISDLIKKGQFRQAVKHCTDALDQGVVSQPLFDFTIQAVSGCRPVNFALAKRAFLAAQRNNTVSIVTYTCFLKAAFKIKAFDIVHDTYTKALSEGHVDSVFFNTYLAHIIEYGLFDKANAAFEEACKRNLAGKKTFSIAIVLKIKQGHFEEAHALFDTKPVGLEHSTYEQHYKNFIDTAMRANQGQEVCRAFEFGLGRGLFDESFICQFISQSVSSRHFEIIHQVYLCIVQNQRNSLAISRAFIMAAAQADHADAAENAYQGLVAAGKSDFAMDYLFDLISAQAGRDFGLSESSQHNSSDAESGTGSDAESDVDDGELATPAECAAAFFERLRRMGISPYPQGAGVDEKKPASNEPMYRSLARR